MRRAWGMAAGLLAGAAHAQTPPATADEGKNVIVITASLPQLKAAADKCAAGGCTPREDIIASVRYAEGQFRKGDYAASRRTIAEAVSRNKDAGKADPIAVSQLYEAQATVAAHYGDRSEVIAAQRASARVLREEMPLSTMSFNAEMRLIDFRAETDPIIAVGSYGIYADRARANGKPLLAMAAQLRQAWLLSRRRDNGGARKLLEGIMASTEPGAESVRLAARIMTARLAREKGDKTATDALLTDLARNPGEKPVLVWSPKMPFPDTGGRNDMFEVVRNERFSGALRLQWVDLGFWIRSDGQVDSIELLRGSRMTSWAAPIVAMIGQRRYAPMREDEGAQGRYRVERYTLTADFDTPSGSLIRIRGRNPRFEQLDLTEDVPAG